MILPRQNPLKTKDFANYNLKTHNERVVDNIYWLDAKLKTIKRQNERQYYPPKKVELLGGKNIE
jgi:hypothetical protein